MRRRRRSARRRSGSAEKGSPEMVTVPVEGLRRPPMMVRSVDLPEPEGPRIPTSSPRRSSRSVLRSAWTVSPPCR